MSTDQTTTRSTQEPSTEDGFLNDTLTTVPEDTSPLKPARPPVGSGTSPLVAQLLALALIALGVVGIQEALVRSAAVKSTSWITTVADAVNKKTPPGWVVVAGAVLIILGLLLVPVVLKRRPRKSLSMKSSTGLYLKTGDLARVITAALDGLDGATDTHVKASRRRLDINVTTIAAKDTNTGITQDVNDRCQPTLAAFENPPRIKVKIKNEDFA